MRYLIIFLFFFAPTDLSLASNVNEKYSGFVKRYFQDLKKKGNNSRGAIALSSEGLYNFQVKKNISQKLINKEVLDICNAIGTKCKIIWQGFQKNPSYKPLTYKRSSSTAEFQGKKFKVQFFYNYGKVKIFKVQEDVLFNNFACGKYKSSEYDEKIDTIIKSSIASFPTTFLSKSGLNYVLLCGQTIAGGLKMVAGLAPMDISGTTGVFLVQVNLHQKFKEAKLNEQLAIQQVNDYYQKCLEEKKNKKRGGKCRKWVRWGRVSLDGNPFLHTFSHELYHIIDYHYGYGFNDEEWSSLNKSDFRKNIKEGSQSTGFASAYGQRNMQEDKAVIFENMVSNRSAFIKKLKEDKILLSKSKLLIKRLKNFYPNINENFWKSFDKIRELNDLTYTTESPR